MLFPEQLIEDIADEYPPFRDLSKSNKFRIASMLWRWTSVENRHTHYRDCIALTRKQNLRLWGNTKTMREVIGSDYFSVFRGDNLAGYCNAFWPKDYMGRALFKTLLDPKPIAFIDDSGNAFRMPRNVILSRAARSDGAYKKSVWQGVKCAGRVPIDQDALRRLVDCSGEPKIIVSALRLLRLAKNRHCPGFIPVAYEQKSTGRIFEVLNHIQSTPRDVRNAALEGFWDYDISNCHFSILNDWGLTLGCRSSAIGKYLNEKKEIRNRLAAECGVEVSLIKESLIALLYGASQSHKEEFSSIARSMGEAATKRFMNDPFIKSLVADIRRLRKPIVAALPRRRGMVGNTLRVFTSAKEDGKKKSDANLLCHALQGCEAQALKAVLQTYGDQILLPMHDGWISRTRLNVPEIEDLLKKVTGFRLLVEEKQLPKTARSEDEKIHSGIPKNTSIPSSDQLLKKFAGNFCTANTSLSSYSSLSLSCLADWNKPPCVRERLRIKKAQIKAYLTTTNDSKENARLDGSFPLSDGNDESHEVPSGGSKAEGLALMTNDDFEGQHSNPLLFEESSMNLLDISQEINAEHEKAYEKARDALQHARRAGELLLEAKQQVGHGGWGAWLRAHCSFSERSAQGYIRLATNWDSLPKSATAVADLSLRDALDLLSSQKEGMLDAWIPPLDPDWEFLTCPWGDERYLLISPSKQYDDCFWLEQGSTREVTVDSLKRPLKRDGFPKFLDHVLKDLKSTKASLQWLRLTPCMGPDYIEHQSSPNAGL